MEIEEMCFFFIPRESFCYRPAVLLQPALSQFRPVFFIIHLTAIHLFVISLKSISQKGMAFLFFPFILFEIKANKNRLKVIKKIYIYI